VQKVSMDSYDISLKCYLSTDRLGFRAESPHCHGWHPSAEVYIRLARAYAWHIVFLDDVPINTAVRVARNKER
jgi:hypothetical protein